MARVEGKVTAATVATYLGSTLAASLLQAVQDHSLVAGLPPAASALLVGAAPALLALLGGYSARHTPRGDQQTDQLTEPVRAEIAREVASEVARKLDELTAAPTRPVPAAAPPPSRPATARHRLPTSRSVP